MSDPATLRVYAERAGEYAALTDGVVAGDPLLAAFIAALPKGARVLDLGCGPGAASARMGQAGLIVDAWDAVPEMVALAGQHAGVTATCADFEDLAAKAMYAGVWANFSLLHAPRGKMPEHLARIAMALRPEGLLHIAVKTGTGHCRDRLGRYYTYYTPLELLALLSAAGLTVMHEVAGRDKGLSGVTEPWIAVTARA